MIELVFLIIFPVIVALLLLLSKSMQLRNVIVKVAAVLIGAGTLILLVTYFSRGMVLFSIPFEPAIIEKGIWGCNQRITSVAEEQNNEI